MKNKLVYLTYQTFPSRKANTIQTIDNLNYLAKYFDIELIFPLRDKSSTDDINVLKDSYKINESIKFNGLKHNYPFGKIKIVENILFQFSQFMWARKTIKSRVFDSSEIFFTRSDWIFYFLSKANKSVVFECHQLSKVRKFVMNSSIKYKNSKIIFLNNNLVTDSKINIDLYKEKLKVIHNGVDSELFNNEFIKNKNEVVFIGNLTRFEESRNLDFYISSFKNKKMPKNMIFTIIGHPSTEVERLKKFIEKNDLQKKVSVKNYMQHKKVIEAMEKSSIGLLINTEGNQHSIKYTSPLKYFEYLYAGLKIVAVNFPAHVELPFSENINFFKMDDEDSFIESIKEAQNNVSIDRERLEAITLKNRAKEIKEFLI